MANTGLLISSADADRIFQPFQRLNDRASHDGFGLGLTIVASIAQVHGGTVTACPRDDGGLSITVTIPWAGSRALDNDLRSRESIARPEADLGSVGPADEPSSGRIA